MYIILKLPYKTLYKNIKEITIESLIILIHILFVTLLFY